jgi:hypothetical protein
MKKTLVWAGIAVMTLCVICTILTTTICVSSANNYPTDEELMGAYMYKEWGPGYYGVLDTKFTKYHPESVAFYVYSDDGEYICATAHMRDKLYVRYYK